MELLCSLRCVRGKVVCALYDTEEELPSRLPLEEPTLVAFGLQSGATGTGYFRLPSDGPRGLDTSGSGKMGHRGYLVFKMGLKFGPNNSDFLFNVIPEKATSSIAKAQGKEQKIGPFHFSFGVSSE